MFNIQGDRKLKLKTVEYFHIMLPFLLAIQEAETSKNAKKFIIFETMEMSANDIVEDVVNILNITF